MSTNPRPGHELEQQAGTVQPDGVTLRRCYWCEASCQTDSLARIDGESE